MDWQAIVPECLAHSSTKLPSNLSQIQLVQIVVVVNIDKKKGFFHFSGSYLFLLIFAPLSASLRNGTCVEIQVLRNFFERNLPYMTHVICIILWYTRVFICIWQLLMRYPIHFQTATPRLPEGEFPASIRRWGAWWSRAARGENSPLPSPTWQLELHRLHPM